MFPKWTTKARGLGYWGNSSSPCSAKNSHAWAARFPPGVTSTFPKLGPRSAWREYQFAFHQIQSAITPPIGLQSVLGQWSQISAALSERSRQRQPQIQILGVQS